MFRLSSTRRTTGSRGRLIHQPKHPVGEVLHGVPLGDRHVAPTPAGLVSKEQVSGAGPHEFVVLAPGDAWALPTVAP